VINRYPESSVSQELLTYYTCVKKKCSYNRRWTQISMSNNCLWTMVYILIITAQYNILYLFQRY
jgi:hypothetical protein